MKLPLVSVIIPTFNRAGLIGETLKSISAQTYVNWECIVVDDGSDDSTQQVVQPFLNDSRFKFAKRPAELPKGGNAARNYGFFLSSGDIVVWFDSDDIMHPQMLEKQLAPLLADDTLDFTVSRFESFTDIRFTKAESYFDKTHLLPLTFQNFTSHKIYWGTINFVGRRRIFEGVRFHESLRSGQEYNFFAKVLIRHPRGIFINEPLSYRRVHSASIQQVQKADPIRRLENKFRVYWQTYLDCRAAVPSENVSYLATQAALFYHKLLLNKVEVIRMSDIMRGLSETLPVTDRLIVKMVFAIAYRFGKGDRMGSAIIKRIIK